MGEEMLLLLNLGWIKTPLLYRAEHFHLELGVCPKQKCRNTDQAVILTTAQSCPPIPLPVPKPKQVLVASLWSCFYFWLSTSFR